MGEIPQVGRRAAALGAMVLLAGAVAVLITALVAHLLPLVAATLGLGVAIAAAVYALTRLGIRRWMAAAIAALAILESVIVLVVFADPLQLVTFLLLVAVAGASARYALGRDIASRKAGASPGARVGPAQRPVLLMNPKSGGGKVEQFHLVDEARRRGVRPILLRAGDDLLQLSRDAIAGGAGVIGMAGGDGSQALVAGVAMEHEVPFVCVPAGTRNHLAMDLGLDRKDVASALDAFGDAVERRMDLGLVGDRVFVNNATMGLYAKVVQSPEYRDNKIGTALAMLPRMLGPHSEPFDLQFTGPDGEEHRAAQLIMVSNGAYELHAKEGFGSRRSVDSGLLGILALRFESSNDVAHFLQTPSGQQHRFHGWMEWTAESFSVRSSHPVQIGLDGEAMVLDPPLDFRIVPGAIRVRVPLRAPGYSPAAAAPPAGWPIFGALLKTAAGRPVSIDA